MVIAMLNNINPYHKQGSSGDRDDEQKLKAVLEGIFFVADAAVSIDTLSNITSCDSSFIKDIIYDLADDYANDPERGLMLAERENGWRLVTKPEIAGYVADFLQPEEKYSLSKAALETLAIIAYKQPVTRSEIEAVRGIKCERILSSLLQKQLIAEQGKLDTLGKPIVYGTTDLFLSTFGLSGLDELPELDEVLYDASAK